jgi:hypothetical protein
MRERRLGILAGTALWAAVAVAYFVGLTMKGRTDVGRALVYNLPIAFLFLVVSACLALRAIRLGPCAFVREYASTILSGPSDLRSSTSASSRRTSK